MANKQAIPNLAIFRIPTRDDDLGTFAEVEISGSDHFVDEEGTVFSVLPGDSYLDLQYDQIVLAVRTERGSKNVAIYSVKQKDATSPAIVHAMDGHDLVELIPQLVKHYRQTQ